MSSTTQEGDKSSEQHELDARAKKVGLPPGTPEAAVEAAELDEVAESGDKAADEAEATVLNWLLGPTEALEFDVETQIDTDDGRQPLTFHLRQLADTEIEKIEEANRTGEGPFAEMDMPEFNAELIAAAGIYLKDKDGRKVALDSTEFRGPVPSTAGALRGRFRYQPGILSMVASEIKSMAGLRNDRVGEAKRSEEKSPPSAEASIAKLTGNS